MAFMLFFGPMDPKHSLASMFCLVLSQNFPGVQQESCGFKQGIGLNSKIFGIQGKNRLNQNTIDKNSLGFKNNYLK